MACAGRPFVCAGGWHYLFLVWGGEREGEAVPEGSGRGFYLIVGGWGCVERILVIDKFVVYHQFGKQ